MKKFLLFVCISVFGALAYSQKSADELSVDKILDHTYQQLLNVNLIKASGFAEQAYQQSKALHYSEGICRSAVYLSQVCFGAGRHEQGLRYLNEAEKEPYYNESAGIRADVSRMKGRIFSNMSLYDKGVSEFRKSLKYSGEIKNPEENAKMTAFAYENLVFLYTIKKQKDSVFYYLKKNMEFSKKQKEEVVYRNLVNLNTAFGMYYSDLGKPDSAVYYFKKSEETAQKHKFPYQSYNYRMWGYLELKQKHYDSAIRLFQNALDNIKDSGVEGELAETYEGLSEAYKAKGNLAKAREYKAMATELDNKISQDKVKSSEYAVKQIVNDEVQNYRQKYGKMLIISAVSAVLILGGLYFYFTRKQKKNKQIIKEIEKESVELKQKVNEGFEELIRYAKENNPEFSARFLEVYPHFGLRMRERNPGLKPSEFTLAAYTYLGFSTKDIAEYTYKAVKTIKNNKYNLRKRLDVPPQADFMVWLRSYVDDGLSV